MKKAISITVAITMFLLFFNGIIRHDVDEGNYLAFAREPQFDCVVEIFRGDTTAIGSGVLISDRHVLSAAHIIVTSDVREETIVRDSTVFTIFQPYNVRLDDSDINIRVNGLKAKAKRVIPHPGYSIDLSDSGYDLLLIELENPVKGIVPALLNREMNELNATVAGCGFGASGPADQPEQVGSFHKKIAGENTIDSLCGKVISSHPSQLMADFDHPSRTDCNLMGSPIPLPLEYSVAGGDSGGGLFRKRSGKWELVGICAASSVDIDRLLEVGYYGQTMAWTRVSVFAGWIEKNMR